MLSVFSVLPSFFSQSFLFLFPQFRRVGRTVSFTRKPCLVACFCYIPGLCSFWAIFFSASIFFYFLLDNISFGGFISFQTVHVQFETLYFWTIYFSDSMISMGLYIYYDYYYFFFVPSFQMSVPI